jgi:hypothetical protein
MLLAEAGLVKGRPATTNRNAWVTFGPGGLGQCCKQIGFQSQVEPVGSIT